MKADRYEFLEMATFGILDQSHSDMITATGLYIDKKTGDIVLGHSYTKEIPCQYCHIYYKLPQVKL